MKKNFSQKLHEDNLKPRNITEKIYLKAFELLKKHPEGLHWSELRSKIEESNLKFHPKTVNGCIWKLTSKFPDKIYKPSRGLFRLLKYKNMKII